MPSPWRNIAVQVKERAVRLMKRSVPRNVHSAIKVITAFTAPPTQVGHELFKKLTSQYTRYMRPAVLRLRAIFAFVFSEFAPYKREITVTLAVFAIVAFISGIFLVRGAAADKQVHAFIFPARISGEGFEEFSSAAAQELGQEAFFADFTATGTATRVNFDGGDARNDASTRGESASPVENATSSEVVPLPAVDIPVSGTTTEPVEAVVPLNAPPSTPSVEQLSTTTVSFLRRATEYVFSPYTALAQDAIDQAPAVDAPVAPVVELAPVVTEPVSVAPVSSTEQDGVPTTPVSESSASGTSPVVHEIVTPEVPVVQNEPRDATYAATCMLMKKACHILTLDGFGVGSPLGEQAFRGASLKMSLAHRASPGVSDRIVVRAYTEGHWQYVGEYQVKDNSDNAMRGGFYSLPLPVSKWSDLTDLSLSIEYVREAELGNAVAYIDSAWIDTAFESQQSIEDLSLLSPNIKAALLAKDEEERMRMRDHLQIDDSTSVDFTHSSLADGATLRVAFGTSSRAVLGRGEEYVSVTNLGRGPERVHLNFHLPLEGGRVEKLEHFAFNIADKKIIDKTAPVAYFCEAGWVASTSTELVDSTSSSSMESFLCEAKNEAHACSSFNDEKTNCFAESVKIGEDEQVTYKRGWVEDAVFAGSFRDEQGIFASAIERLVGKMPAHLVPGSLAPKAYALPVDIEPGATRYFRVRYTTPLNLRGDLYVEVAAASGNFGLGSTEFSGKWNWRISADVVYGDVNESLDSATSTATSTPVLNATSTEDVSVDTVPKFVSFSLSKAPLEFWDKVKDDGSDIRISDEDGQYELPFALLDFDKSSRIGRLSAKLPVDGGIMPRIYIYAGDVHATLPRAELFTGEVATDVIADADAVWGKSEFVIPGEHRKFDVDGGRERAHVNRMLSKTREFRGGENPKFSFQYKPQTSATLRAIRRFFGVKPFTVDSVRIKQIGIDKPVDAKITYGDNLSWDIELNVEDARKIIPGRATLAFTVHESGRDFSDSYEFEWGLLTINANKATFERGETALFTMGSISETGNTVCDAKLKLFVTTPASSTEEILIAPSGKCDGNNYTDTPDYSASMVMADAGEYLARLVRLDDSGAMLSEVHDTFKVEPRTPFVVERTGPTRINPKYPYTMTIKLAAREAYVGDVLERVPSDFTITAKGGADVTENGDVQELRFHMDMKAGESYQVSYEFDTPDKSPFIYFLGPATIGSGDGVYTEPRKWQIASDAAGKMLVYWSNAVSIPGGWTCVSCTATSTFYQRYVMGSSTYGVIGGASTSTHTFVTSVSSALYSNPAPGGTVTGLGIYRTHTHTFTPAITAGSNLPPSKSLRIIQSNAAGDVNIPATALIMFEEIPASGFTAINSYEGYFPYGENTLGTQQGTSTHSHTISGATGVPVTTQTYNAGGGAAANATTHTHNLAGATTTVVSNLPPFYNVRLASYDTGGSLPNGAIAMWDADPAAGWLDNSSSTSAVLSGRFAQIMSSAGGNGGSAAHNHSDMTGVSLPATAGTRSSTGGAFLAPAAHTHTANFTHFSTTNNLPRYATAIFAKKSWGVPDFTQKDFRFYANVNSVDPVDAWPTGAVDLPENTSVTQADQRMRPNSIFRVRMNMFVGNATATPSSNSLALQYATTSNTCAAATDWEYVGDAASSTAVRGYNNLLVADNALISGVLLASSTAGAKQGYEEHGTAASGFKQTAGIGTVAEWDFALQANSNIAPSSQYCLRMVNASGTIFSNYTKYPQFYTNFAPEVPMMSAPFNHAKVNTATPVFKFGTTDGEGNGVNYQIQVATDVSFASTIIDKTTVNDQSYFSNITNPLNDTLPYNSGDTISFTPDVATLSNGATYWWRVRAVDPYGSTQYGEWGGMQSFTVDTSLTRSAWFQTTNEQFSQGVMTGATTTSGAVRLSSPSVPGQIVSQEIRFADGVLGTVWGDMTASSTGAVRRYVEFKDLESNWLLVPDSVLSGNSVGTTSATVNLRSIDPGTYPSLRLRAELATTTTPVLDWWGVSWDNKTLAPKMLSPFNHAKVSQLQPTLSLSSTDPSGLPIYYDIQWATSTSFAVMNSCGSLGSNTVGAPTVCAAAFSNITTPADTSPFNSSDTVNFTFPSNLVGSTTYYWRARAQGQGSGAWSFWSPARAFTVDTSTTTTAWYQVMNDQWNMNTLSGAVTIGTSSVSVATTSDKIMITYGSYNSPYPKYMVYSSSTQLSSSTNMLPLNSAALWMSTKASPAEDEFVSVAMDTGGAISGQVYMDGAWASSTFMTFTNTSANTFRKSFDVAYQKDGKALAAWCDGSSAQYSVFNGVSWSAPSTISSVGTAFGATNCEVIKMASNPSKPEIVAIFRNTGAIYRAEVWDGVASAWKTGGPSTNLASATITEGQHDGLAVEYSRSGALAMVVTSDANNNSFRSYRWNGSTWTTIAAQATAQRVEWARLHANPFTDELLLCTHDRYAAGTDDGGNADFLRWNATTSAWIARVNTEYYQYSRHGHGTDCMYETKPGRVGRFYVASDEGWSTGDGTASNQRTIWDSYSTLTSRWQSNNAATGPAQAYAMTPLYPGLTWTMLLARAAVSGDILALALDANTTASGPASLRLFKWNGTQHFGFNGSGWGATTTSAVLASSTVVAAPFGGNPFGQQFDMASQQGFTTGRVYSQAIEFADGNSPSWQTAFFNATAPASTTALMSIEYKNSSGAWGKIPDVDLPGNSVGTSSPSVNLKNLNVNTYATIRMRADLTCATALSCAKLNWWRVEWTAGIPITGFIKQFDRTTNVTSGTLSYSVNGGAPFTGVGTIAGDGTWTIANANYKSGDIVTVWVNSSTNARKAVAVVKYSGSGGLTGIPLYENWLDIGSGTQAGQTITNVDIAKMDFQIEPSMSTSTFMMHNAATSTGNLTMCAWGACGANSIIVATGTTWRPRQSGGAMITTYNLVNNGTITTDSNTFKIAGDYVNTSAMSSDSSTFIFNATSSVHTINQTGASQYKFNHLTFGEAGTTASWSASSSLYAIGNLALNYGTLSPAAQNLNVEGNFAIAAGGVFAKGSATTTFLGSLATSWSDLSSGQDMGNVVVDGSPKSLTLAGNMKASRLVVGADDTLNMSGYTLTMLGNFVNNGVLNAGTGMLTMATSGIATINQGVSSLNNLTIASGTVSWISSSATTTGNVLLTGGTTTFPTAFTVGGSFTQTGGVFTAAATTTFNASASGKSISVLNNFANLAFAGSGGWAFASSATSTGNVTVSSGVLTLPSGTLAVQGNFTNLASLTHNSGTLAMNGGTQSLAAGSSVLGNLIVRSGTTTLVSAATSIAGSLTNNGVLSAAGSEIVMSGGGSPVISTGVATLSKFTVSGSGNFTMNGNATTTGDFTLTGNVGGFTYESGRQLNVGGYFANNMAIGASWVGTTIRLFNGGAYAVNTKLAAPQSYNNLILDNSTQLRMWKSSVSGVTTNGTSSLYAMDWGNALGTLRIFGAYTQNTGTAYWNYANDFDGASASRAVSVQLAGGASVAIAPNATLEVVGTSSASSTVTALSGSWNMSMSSSTWKSKFANWSGMSAGGIVVGTSTDISLLSDSKFTASSGAGNKTISFDASVVTANHTEQYVNVGFASTTMGQFSVSAPSTAGKYIRFKNHYGALSGEASDADTGNPGEIRWDDSDIPISISGTVFQDAGITPMDASVCDDFTNRIFVKVLPSGAVRAASCASADGTFTVLNVPTRGETTMIVYLKGISQKAVTVTRSASTNLTGIDLYTSRINLRHEDAVPMTTPAMSGFDATNDSDVRYTITAGNLTVPSDMELRVLGGKTYVPGGNITLNATTSVGSVGGGLYLASGGALTLVGTEALLVGGDLTAESGAVFTTASSTIDLVNTAPRKVIASSTLTFWNLSHAGTASTTLASSIQTLGSVSLADGYLTGSSNLDHYGSSFGGGLGYVNFTGGTLTVRKTSTLGGVNNQQWTFSNLAVASGATTTKTGGGVTSISGQLNLTGTAFFAFGTTTLEFTGAGNPLSGTSNIDFDIGGTTRFAPRAGNNLTVPARSYANIEFGGALTSTTTMEVGTTTVRGSVNSIGDAPFVHNGSVIEVTGSGTQTVHAGSRLLGTLRFNGVGSYAVTNPITTQNLQLEAASLWTVANGASISVLGKMHNNIAAKTDWATSTLALSGQGVIEVNARGEAGDVYNIVSFATGTAAQFWGATIPSAVLLGGGAASFNDVNISGKARIIGSYVRNSGSEHWSYANDFDGTLLGIGFQRQVSVVFDPLSSAVYGGTSSLEVIGSAIATTTIVASSSSSYSLTASGTLVQLGHADFSGMNASGIQFKGQVSVVGIDDVYFHSPGVQGSLVTVDGSVIEANPVRILNRVGFASAGGFNVTALGSTLSVWRFTNHYGNRAGEANDSDPGGDPGYVAWDDSVNQVNIGGYMRNNSDTGVSSMCNGVTPVIALKVEGSNAVSPVSCAAGSGYFSFTSIVPLQGGVISVFATGTATMTVGYILDPQTNINNLYLYDNTISLRNDNAAPINDVHIGKYSYDVVARPNILADVSSGSLVVRNGGSLRIWDGKTYAPSGSSVTIPGSLYLGTNANIVGTSTLTFTGTGVLSVFASSSASLPPMTFNGSGSWTMTRVATTTGSLVINAGSVTLPNGNLAIGGSFTNNAIFNANNGTTTFFATSSQSIKSNGHSFGNIVIAGAGSFTMSDNATTTSVNIFQGSLMLPARLTVQGDFINTSGTIASVVGTTTLAGGGSHTLRAGVGSFSSLALAGGSYMATGTNITALGNFSISSGVSFVMPEGNFSVGGSFINGGSFMAATSSTLTMTATSTGKVIQVGTSTLGNLVVNGSGGGWTAQSATTTGSVTISVPGYTQSSGSRLVSLGAFVNNGGGTWTGSTLRLGASTTLSTKSAPSTAYAALELDPFVSVKSWNASYATVTPSTGASLYAMNAGGGGKLNIYGEYVNTSGVDHWSATTDFDGTAVGARSVNVKFAAGASARYATSSLSVVGTSLNHTSVSSLSGVYALKIENGTFKSIYADFASTSALGVEWRGNTSVPQMDNSSFAASGTALTIDSATIDSNASMSYVGNSFTGTSTNISVDGMSSSSIMFTGALGALAGDAYDSDGDSTGCGSIRFDDSSCQISEQYAYRWRNDDGGEQAPDINWFGGATSSWTSRMRVNVYNNSSSAVVNAAVKVSVPFTTGMRADYTDLRFTDSGGTTTIPYWIEKYDASTALVWFRTNLPMSSSADVYVYYGNAGATASTMNGSSVFSYFEDFAGYPGSFLNEYTKLSTTTFPYDTYTHPGASFLSGNTTKTTSGGAARRDIILGPGVGSNIRIRAVVNEKSSGHDSICTTFGVQAVYASNTAACIDNIGSDPSFNLRRDVKNRGGGTDGVIISDLNQSPGTVFDGWYEVVSDWYTQSATTYIRSRLVDSFGFTQADTGAISNSSYSSGGFGHAYQTSGGSGWRVMMAYPYVAADPTVRIMTPQGHGGATWMSAENAPASGVQQGDNLRLRIGVSNTGVARPGMHLRLDYADKTNKTNCASISTYTPVPPAASCGTSPLCMRTSSQITDGGNTTPLLGTPKSVSFAQGLIVTDPNNKTGSYNFSNGTYSDFEYAVSVSNFAVGTGYCLRVSDDGVGNLDSYSKIAEFGLFNKPQFSDWKLNSDNPISLTGGTTTIVTATGTVTDFNGWNDIDASSTSAVFYRSGVVGGGSCSNDPNSCYAQASTTCSLSNCSGNNCAISCAANMYYFTEPTDIGLYAGESWKADVSIASKFGYTGTSTASAELNSFKSYAYGTTTIDFGQVEVGSSTGSFNPQIAIINTGNTTISPSVGGTDLTAAGSLIATSSEYASTTAFNVESCTFCVSVASAAPLGMNITKQVSLGLLASKLIYLGLKVPIGVKGLTHTGTITVYP